MIDKNQRLLTPENLLIKEKDGKYLVFNSNVPAWIVTNQVGLYILRKCDGIRTVNEVASEVELVAKNICSEDVMNFLTHASEKRIFEMNRQEYDAPMFPLRNIYINITERCNLNCIYCYADERRETGQTLSYYDYVLVLDSIAKISNNVTITFTGGEPLTSPLLFDVARYAKTIGFNTFLLTNGTLITEGNLATVSELFDDIKISLDGSCSYVNDLTRGNGSYEHIIRGIVLLDSIGKAYTLSMTVTKKNIQDIRNMNEKYGRKLSYAPYFWKRDSKLNEELAVTGAEYYYALRKVVGVNPYCEIDSVISSNIRNRVISKCSIADGSISISSNGDVYPCQLLHFDVFKAGNITEKAFEEIYRESPIISKMRNQTVDKIKGCDECPIALLCGGGCIARHYYENGTLEEAGSFCEYEKLAILDALLDRYSLEDVSMKGAPNVI